MAGAGVNHNSVLDESVMHPVAHDLPELSFNGQVDGLRELVKKLSLSIGFRKTVLRPELLTLRLPQLAAVTGGMIFSPSCAMF